MNLFFEIRQIILTQYHVNYTEVAKTSIICLKLTLLVMTHTYG